MDFYKYPFLLKEGEIGWQVTGKTLKKLRCVAWVIEKKRTELDISGMLGRNDWKIQIQSE